ncbi:MAG TPA: hypothetical protein VI248_26015 [Kineosporiaceae bacterium]
MSHWSAPTRRLPARLAVPATLVAVLLVAVLTACGAPSYQFMASDTDDLALKMPRSWNLVNSGVPPTSDGTPAETGNWFAVYDAADHPSMDHVTAVHASAPVAVIRTLVVTKEQGRSVTDDTLKDAWLPVSDKSRATAGVQGFTGTNFHLLDDQKLDTGTANGVHVVFSYDLGQGPEVFDQIVLTDKNKTRVHLLLVHCSASCYDTNRRAITDSMGSFTVRRT